MFPGLTTLISFMVLQIFSVLSFMVCHCAIFFLVWHCTTFPGQELLLLLTFLFCIFTMFPGLALLLCFLVWHYYYVSWFGIITMIPGLPLSLSFLVWHLFLVSLLLWQ